MLWLALAAVVVTFLVLAARRSAVKPAGGVGLALALAALVGVALTARLGPRALALMAPTLLWFAFVNLMSGLALDQAPG